MSESNGTQLPKQHELTPRQQAEIATFASALDNIPDELFWDNITAEPQRDRPQRWIE